MRGNLDSRLEHAGERPECIYAIGIGTAGISKNEITINSADVIRFELRWRDWRARLPQQILDITK